MRVSLSNPARLLYVASRDKNNNVINGLNGSTELFRLSISANQLVGGLAEIGAKMSDTKQVFSPAQRSLLTDVLNRIIPPKDKLPGAGNLGISEYIERVASANANLTRLFNDGLAKIEVVSGQNFSNLPNATKDELLRRVESNSPKFFDQLVLHCYNGYYTNQTVFDAIGYKLPDPPKPGAQPELLDVSLLDQQRKRDPFWKKV